MSRVGQAGARAAGNRGAAGEGAPRGAPTPRRGLPNQELLVGTSGVEGVRRLG